MTAAQGGHHAASAALVLPERQASSARPRRSARSGSPLTTTDAGAAAGSLDVGPVATPATGSSGTTRPEPQLRPIRSVATGRAGPAAGDSATG